MTLPIAPDDLPAVVAELRENRVAYYAVEGEPCSGDHCLCGQTFPPSEWVALAEATCEHQKLREVDVVGAWDDGRSSGCPDCVGGKPKHTLTVECSHAEGEPECDCQCPTCVSSDDDLWHGAVSVDVVVRDVLPVCDSKTWNERPYVAVVLDVKGRVWSFGPDDEHGDTTDPIEITTLGPDLIPGMWVAVIEASS